MHWRQDGRRAHLRWAPIVVLTVTALLYTWRLGEAPVYISNDEAHFSFHAQSIAASGRDLNGVRFPMFIEMIDPLLPDNAGSAWWQPVLFYATSASLLVFPFTEWSVRLPVAIIGVINVALMYAIVNQMFASRALAWLAALLLAVTPAHFVMSRQALDYLCPVPFVLAWLWSVDGFMRRRQRWLLTAAGALLGIGTFSHISAWALMPIFTLITCVVVAVTDRSPRTWAAFAGGLLVPLALAGAWLSMHPDVFGHVVGRYGFQATAVPADRALTPTLTTALSLYWDYFNPSFLFFAGGSNPTQTTSRAGVFLLAFAVLIPAGAVALARRLTSINLVVLAGFVLAPLPVVFVMGTQGDYSIARAIMIVPFGVLLAIHGLAWLWRSGGRVRLVAVAAVAVSLVQFALFASDYFGEYQLRVAPRLDALNTGGVAAAVMAQHAASPIPAVYLSDDLDSKAVRWRFHMVKARQYELWERTHYFSTEMLDGDRVARGSVVVLFHNDPLVDRLLATGAYERAATVAHPAGDAAAAILVRSR